MSTEDFECKVLKSQLHTNNLNIEFQTLPIWEFCFFAHVHEGDKTYTSHALPTLVMLLSHTCV
jgi:hypothetical protein